MLKFSQEARGIKNMSVQTNQYIKEMTDMFNVIRKNYEETGVLNSTEILFLEIYKKTIGV